MAIDTNKIVRRSECIPGILRNEIVELDDIAYTETFDDETGKRQFGYITMYNGVKVCLVGSDGKLSMNMPTNWVTNRNDLMKLQADIQRLDEFLSAVVKNYK